MRFVPSRKIPLLTAAPVAVTLLLAGCGSMSNTEAPTASAPTPTAWQQQALDDIRILSADDMGGRDTGSAGGKMARDYIVGRLEAMGVAAPPVGRFQPWEAQSRGKTWNGINVIGLIPGTRVTDKYIVVTAHYDHVGTQEGLIYNGADDNASGVATMLALAADLKRQAPEHSVLIVGFDGEEHGLLGAKHFVEAPPVPLTSIAMNLNFDMTARAETDGKLWVTGTYQNPQFRPILEGIPANGAVSLAFGKDTPQDTGTDNWVEASDHGPFYRAQVPFLYLGVNYHPDYHRPSDDFERITPAVFISSTELAIASFRALDQNLNR
ncbi:M28 family peptidase [Brevundimonas sp.]|uniref:M28 family peptidase n=1 Tax=Brevundimonas sp. TaxID=1871086 RepID=UPI0035B0CF36